MEYDLMITAYKRPQMLKELIETIPLGLTDNFIYFDNNDKETYDQFKDNKNYYCILIPEQWYCQKINNYHCSRSTKKGVIVLNDDMRLEPNALENLIEGFERVYPDTDGLVGMNQYLISTGSKCAAWLIGRGFSDRFENREAIYPGYLGRFGDSELMITATGAGKFYWCEDSKIYHWQAESVGLTGDFVKDAARMIQEGVHGRDAEIYLERTKDNEFMKRIRL